MKRRNKGHSWTFQRIGGLDQVTLETSDDIAHLPELDPKLWVALSCPASGLEFNQTTLALLDQDNDKRIRIPEVNAAIEWLKPRLKQLNTITECNDFLSLTAINTQTPEGKKLYTTAKSILSSLDKHDKTISEADLTCSKAMMVNSLFNGDGVLPALPQFGDDIVNFINDALRVMGGVNDLSGSPGINITIAEAFVTSLTNWLNWRQSLGNTLTPFNKNTSEVWQLVRNLKDKIDDYFMRTQLASYAPQAETVLNVDEKFIVPTENGLLDDATLAALPLSRIEANKSLNLKVGLNPIWQSQVAEFSKLVKPFLAHADKLTLQEWHHIQAVLGPYAEAAKSKPTPIAVTVTLKPTSTIDALGEKRVVAILKNNIVSEFTKLAEKDSTTPAVAADVAEVHRLIVYNQHLYRLLLNFSSFHDFFDLDRTAAFQAGKLYIDGRCCSLCILVKDITQHMVLANYSELFLLYCQCTRKNPTGNNDQDNLNIVAAMTAGDANFLLVGRNGVFIDNEGNDWDATVVNIIVKPISIRQAVLSPYQRLGRFITQQINKWASSKSTAVTNSATQNLQTAANPPANANPPKFDLGRSMGIFAAIGLALGALGTAVATILRSLLQLAWWQLPLVFVGIFLLISGPSVIMAWLKLRQRTLGPLLEASGWAINGKVKINFLLGSQLTSRAVLPENASLQFFDSTKKRRVVLWLIFWLALLLGVITTGGLIWHKNTFNLKSQLMSKFEKHMKSKKTAIEPEQQQQQQSESVAPTQDSIH